MGQHQTRVVAGAASFAFAAVWITAGFTAAVACLAAAGIGVALTDVLRRWSIETTLARVRTLQRHAMTRMAEQAPPKSAPRRPIRIQEQPSRESNYGW